MNNAINSGWTPELRDEVCGLYATHTAAVIAGMLHERGFTFSRHAIIGVANRAGLKKPIAQRTESLKGDASTGSLAFKVINGIKKQQSRAAAPGIGPALFVCQPEPDIVPLRLSLSDLERGDDKCRWPYDALPDESGEGSFRFCGHPVCSRMVLGKPRKSPYCACHAQIASGKGTESERRAVQLPGGVAA